MKLVFAIIFLGKSKLFSHQSYSNFNEIDFNQNQSGTKIRTYSVYITRLEAK